MPASPQLNMCTPRLCFFKQFKKEIPFTLSPCFFMLKLQVLVHWIIMSKELCTQCLETTVHQGKETSSGESFLHQEAE